MEFCSQLLSMEFFDIGNFIILLQTLYTTIKDNYIYFDLNVIFKWIFSLVIIVSQLITSYRTISAYVKKIKAHRELKKMIDKLSDSNKKT